MKPEALKELLLALPPMTEEEMRIQKLSFAYGQLELTTNHRTGLTFEEFCEKYKDLV